MRQGVRFSALAVLLLPVCAVSSAADTASQSGDEGREESARVAIHRAYVEWVQATNAKDIESWVSFVAPGAFFQPPNHPRLNGNQEIREFYEGLFEDPLFALDCRQEQVEVATSGDLAWSTGSCRATFSSQDGEAASDVSKWVKVWKRQADGSWKARINIWNSDLSGQE